MMSITARKRRTATIIEGIKPAAGVPYIINEPACVTSIANE
jgi:hypothetical protein